MLAAVFRGPREIALIEVPVPVPGPDEVRVRLQGCGICGSNLPVWEGRPWFRYPFEAGAPGHEGWGVIDAIGSEVTRVAVGDRVTLYSFHAFAEYDVAPEVQVVPMPSGWPSSVAFPGEALGCAFNILRKSTIRSGETVAIVGVGFLGALLCGIAAQAGAFVIGISRRQTSVDMARISGAASTLIWNDSREVQEQVRDLTDGRGCDVVIEAAGAQASLDLASALVRTSGRLVIAGYHQDGPRLVDMQSWNWRALQIVNAHERDSQICVQGMGDAVRAIEEGRHDPRNLFTHRYELSHIDQAFESLRMRPEGFLKATLIYD